MGSESIIIPEDRIILALDGMEFIECVGLLDKFDRAIYTVKIHSLWDKKGPEVIKQLWRDGCYKVWVDLKLKDIPRTVGERAKVMKKAGADFLTVFADGGIKMIRAAVANGPEIIAVTVLTSLSLEEVKCIYGGESAKAVSVRLAMLAKEAGVKYIICSPQEVGYLSETPQLAGMEFWVPGIRRAGEFNNDQMRFDTPSAAIKAGATRLVIGSSITKAPDPKKAFDEIAAEIESALLEINQKGGEKR